MSGETWGSARLAEALGVKKSSIASMVHQGQLPRPDGRNGRYVYWTERTVRSLLARRKDGDRRCMQKTEGYYNSREICGMVPGMMQQNLYNYISQGMFPRASMHIGRICYWAAGDVDPLVPDLRLRFAHSGLDNVGKSSGVDPDRAYSAAEIMKLVPSLPRKVLLDMVEEGTFPQPARIARPNGAQRLIWSGADIAGKIAEIRAEIRRLEKDAWFSRDICRLFGLADTIPIHNLVMTGKIPEHDGRLFKRRYWLKSSVAAWLEKYAGKRVGIYVPDGILAVPEPWRVQVRAAPKAPDSVLDRAIERARQNEAYYASVAAELERERERRNARKRTD